MEGTGANLNETGRYRKGVKSLSLCSLFALVYHKEIQVYPSMNVFKNRGGKDRLRLVGPFLAACFESRSSVAGKKNEEQNTRSSQFPPRHKLGKVPRSCFFLIVTFLLD